MRYDNINDAKNKLGGTMVYFDGSAVGCRQVEELETGMRILLCPFNNPNGRGKWEDILDKRLAYMEYNIGYVNDYEYATWFMRMPYKQYRQGLRVDQCEYRDESGQFRVPGLAQQQILNYNDATAKMLENKYPSFEEAHELVKSGKAQKMAFHVDFAIYKDRLHGRIVLEHKGIPTAFEDLNKTFKCMPELAWLRESIREQRIQVI